MVMSTLFEERCALFLIEYIFFFILILAGGGKYDGGKKVTKNISNSILSMLLMHTFHFISFIKIFINDTCITWPPGVC